MNLALFLKMFSDICFYLAFGCFFGSTFGQQSFLMPAAALMALCAVAARWIDGKKPGSLLRFTPLLLFGALALYPPDLQGWIVLIPPAGFLVYALWKRDLTPSYYQENDNFFLMLKIPILPLISALLLMQKTRLERFALPYLVAFLLGSVLLLRLLRHDEETMSRPQFRVMNLLAVAGAVLGAVIVFSKPFRHGVAAILSLILTGIVDVIFFLLKPFFPLLDKLFTALKELMEQKALEHQQVEQDYQVVDAPFAPDIPVPDTPPKDLSTLWAILVILFFIALLVGVILLFRKLLSQRVVSRVEPGTIRRFFVNDPERRREGRTPFGRSPAQRVRYWYGQLLLLTQKYGGRLDKTMTTRQQLSWEKAVFHGTEPEQIRLRELYLPARYGGTVTEADAREAKELFKAVKKNEKERK